MLNAPSNITWITNKYGIEKKDLHSYAFFFFQKNYGSRSKKGETLRFELSHNALNRKPQK